MNDYQKQITQKSDLSAKRSTSFIGNWATPIQ